MMDLTGKNALITGASGGIGKAIAEKLYSLGASVALTGTRESVLNEVAASLGERAHPIVCNLSDSEALNGLVPAAIEAMGSVDILVNNAGITKDNLFMRMKQEEWDDVIAVNLTAAFKLSKAVLRGMMKARHGRIIQITSVVGVTGNPGQGNYCATKAGIIGMSKSLAQEVASRNITVNSIAPGFIETAMTDVLDEKQHEAIMNNVPAGRLGRPDEIASAVAFLASDEASYITGQTLHVNGGMAMI
ncbi:MAG: 3-oxoacyl-ACP reductase FabG [Hyphomicrobiales bacterium]